ncbi:hypothetical protein DWQ65_12805 [Treponema phagedenis]|uniref:Uncharacterized protein n=1 Tax=Treponema phagedenis TaxID=162 RepID=A0A0B7GVH1_TREPH|nr:hypothetical protein [Treponema phagedenis]NVP23333.1 hypothetical protein [Treponema phagedenis]QEJ95548.1 hypothetical protein FUT79_10265 [Treponema phagedenis]QEJ98440.1 hypothetical protein FUT82_10830 [Treponema phagedenis]QEK01401.1 hypothetical protein FUT84_09735 [Treponema phagedenis]QEK03948.1 hypothetical protein FUT83_09140 [Treponema phagedenis]
MASDYEKKDSIDDFSFPVHFDDNSKLDMYGVWIKKSARDESDKDFQAIENNKDASSPADDIENLSDFAVSFPEEEQGIHSEENSFIQESSNHADGQGDDMAAMDINGFETLDLDDFLDDSFDDSSQSDQASQSDEQDKTPIKEADFTPVEFSMEDFEAEISRPNEEEEGEDPHAPVDIDIDFSPAASTNTETSEGDDSLNTITEIHFDLPDSSPSSSSNSAIKTEFSEASEFDDLLDGLGSSSASTTVNVPDKRKSEINLNVDIEDAGESKAEEFEFAKTDIESVDISIFDNDPVVPEVAVKAEEPDKPKQEEPEEKLSAVNIEVPETDMFFDDVGALTDDLMKEEIASTENSLDSVPEHHAAQSLETENLLRKIAEEIAGIKTELADLKKQVNEQATAPLIHKDDVIQTEEKKPAAKSSGFFSDDDTDETIALTGDELNNILITADFTEEANTEEYEIPEFLDSTNENLAAQEIENTEEKSELEDFKPAHIVPSGDDLSYLDDQSDIPNDETMLGSVADDYITKPDFESEVLEEPEDLTIEALNFETDNIADIQKETDEAPVHADDLSDIDFLTEDISEIPAEQEIELPEIESQELTDSEANEVSSLAEKDAAFFDETLTDKIPVHTEEIKPEPAQSETASMPLQLKEEIKSVLSYMDRLLESLPEEKIEEFAKSEYFNTYKRLFDELGIS